MPSHRRRVRRSRRSRKPLLIAVFIIAIVAIAIAVAWMYSNPSSTYTLTIYTVGQGSVLQSNSTYSSGATVDLQAVSASNWTFYGWSGDASVSGNTSITMNGDKVVTAVFYENGNAVELTTSMGVIVIQLRDDMPITTENFKNLTNYGIYDNTTFHRIRAGFMIQGGDPTGTGYGDPSIPSIQDEFTSDNKNLRGTIAMANKGENYPNSGSSQFFINLDYNSYLDTLHPVFGTVIAGMDVVDAIAQVEVEENPISGEVSQPVVNVTILAAEVLG